MLDINFIRSNLDLVKKSMQDRGIIVDFEALLEIDNKRREAIASLQKLQERKNKIAENVAIKKRNKEDYSSLIEEGELIGDKISKENDAVLSIETSMKMIIDTLPNILDQAVPFGKNEEYNVLVERKDIPYRKKFDFKPKRHFEIFGEDLMDFDNAVKISGSRFVILKSHLALLERALKNFMLDIHTKKFGYTEMSVPYLVNYDSVYGIGHLPNFKDDMFLTLDGYYLISTSEVSLTNIFRDKMLKESEIEKPIRMTAFSSCFRSEAGASGKDTRGIIRQHQFQKVELVSITLPEQSETEHLYMLTAAEEILKTLDLHYRISLLCTGDTGFCSRKTYDIEVWLPGENCYREISSCSNTGDFQTRRMNAKVKRNDGKKDFLHTLNGSGLAIGRTIVAILENYQQKDGSVLIPNALLPYMGGIERITPSIK